jgi:excinuclease ABC subunit A
LGPEGGENGGQLLAVEPEQIMKDKKSITGHYLKDKL